MREVGGQVKSKGKKNKIKKIQRAARKGRAKTSKKCVKMWEEKTLIFRRCVLRDRSQRRETHIRDIAGVSVLHADCESATRRRARHTS